jgi:hypothetical protein
VTSAGCVGLHAIMKRVVDALKHLLRDVAWVCVENTIGFMKS